MHLELQVPSIHALKVQGLGEYETLCERIECNPSKSTSWSTCAEGEGPLQKGTAKYVQSSIGTLCTSSSDSVTDLQCSFILNSMNEESSLQPKPHRKQVDIRSYCETRRFGV
ncbi:hypothetical protein MPTK1_2g24100 [Marchantia polymorpha subsp. ruderalis]|uniref:Uncharacterized protein n=1 Tax=Marchantia polymorpha TaxID=3197 RepID=A0A2R6WPD2_MARPO|nr:hypothetical protein MARPO_0069s0059 [Marchantia polymorpha]BBN03514.1 hypothetical protein Mp_2g24100 [Marchantia polymorpha subsp. ruderalis]|eukprot:PTQ35720.1 hypothetical protein MARPO_0069s0059 [Marchantia polymorpha]